MTSIYKSDAGRQAVEQRYRATLGNLAHSLKTPLAVMRQTLGADHTQAKTALDAEIDRMMPAFEKIWKRIVDMVQKNPAGDKI